MAAPTAPADAAEDDVVKLASQQGVVATGTNYLPPEYCVFVAVPGYPLWPAWIVPAEQAAQFDTDPVFKVKGNYERVARGGAVLPPPARAEWGCLYSVCPCVRVPPARRGVRRALHRS